MKTIGICATAIAVAATLAFAAPPVAQADSLNIYAWADYISADVIAAFTKETGIAVEITPYDSVEIPMTKLLIGSSGFDLMVTAAFQVPQLIQAGVLRELDHAKLPNLANLDPVFRREKLAKIDDGTRYSIPYDLGMTTLVVNVEKVRAILGPDAPLDTLGLLFDPTIAAKLKSCGITVLDSPADVISMAMLYNGVKDLYHPSDADLEQATATIAAIRPYIKYFDNVLYAQDLSAGEICMSMGWTNDIVRAGFEAAEAGLPVNLQTIFAKEGAILWSDHLVVPKDAPHPDAALAFLDFLMRGESGGAITNTVLIATINTKGRAFVAPHLLQNTTIFPPQDWLNRLPPIETFDAALTRAVTRAYTKAKTGT